MNFSKNMILLGYAADGFPIYNSKVPSNANDLSSPLMTVKSSYRLKTGKRPENPSNLPKAPSGNYDGTFVQDYEYDLKNIYSFDSEKMEKCHKFIKMTKEKINKQLVSIHVRRTDFLIEADTHFVCDKDYYINAINQFGNNYYYLIFTDDKEWCAKEFANIPKIIMNNNTEIDLILMSLCDHNIISNSSYSWWGSWLNENLSKTVIAPSRWYNKIAPKNWQEIYRKDMILI